MPKPVTIDLSGITDHILPNFRYFLADRHRYLVFCGGAGTGKSYFCAQKVIYRALTEPESTLYIVRKVQRTHRVSTYPLTQKVLSDMGLSGLAKINKSEMSIEFPAPIRSKIVFLGLDDPEKIKSLFSASGVWIEEATELSFDDFAQIDLRLRGKTKEYYQITMSTNPVGGTLHWIYREFFQKKKEDSYVCNPSVYDNIYIDANYIRKLEREENEDIKAIYLRGEWVDLKGLVFPANSWKVVDIYDKGSKGGIRRRLKNAIKQKCVGVDFGYNAPSAAIFVGDMDEATLLHQVLYDRKLTNSELIQVLKDREESWWGNDIEYVCDSAEPQRIEEMRREGLNAIPANKTKNSVVGGIMQMRSKKIWVSKTSSDLIKELQTYSWATDSSGNSLDKPVPSHDHGIDAARYGVSYITGDSVFDPEKPVAFTGHNFMPV